MDVTSVNNDEHDKPSIISTFNMKEEDATTAHYESTYTCQWIQREANAAFIKMEPKVTKTAQIKPGSMQ